MRQNILLCFFFLVINCRAYSQSKSTLTTDSCTIYIPGALSTEDDGFEIFSNCSVYKLHLDIFDRWGKFIYSGDSLGNFDRVSNYKYAYMMNWNFYSVQEDTYVWHIKYAFKKEDEMREAVGKIN